MASVSSENSREYSERSLWDVAEARFWSSYIAQKRHIEALLGRQRELEEARNSPNLREHVPRMEK